MGICSGGLILLSEILFGPAGYPAEAKGKPERVFQILSEVGVNALEYAAVHGLRVSEKNAIAIGKLASKFGISMSLHAAYYISLASKEQKTRERSKQRLVKALKLAPSMGVKRIVFHPGTHGGLSREEAHTVIRDALTSVRDDAGEQGRGAWLAPEIAGKISMYGSVEQIIRLCQEVEGCIPTIDWAHLYARSQGTINDVGNYEQVLNQFENELGSLFIENMHFHISGITFTEKGEASHKPLGGEWGPDLYPLMKLVDDIGYKPTFICESPDPLRGALYAKFLLEEIRKAKQ
jgi:deoxyribonuclease-4